MTLKRDNLVSRQKFLNYWAAKNFFNFKWVAKKIVWEPMHYMTYDEYQETCAISRRITSLDPKNKTEFSVLFQKPVLPEIFIF
jgi:hypothetical protein